MKAQSDTFFSSIPDVRDGRWEHDGRKSLIEKPFPDLLNATYITPVSTLAWMSESRIFEFLSPATVSAIVNFMLG